MQAQHCQYDESKFIQVQNIPPPMAAHSLDVVAVSDDDSSIDTLPHVVTSKSEGEI